MKTPLLSICIPTYQRCSTLIKTVESITSNKHFQHSDDIEIVISNNASTDNTDNYCVELLKEFPGKIKYNRNFENIHDLNYELVLRLASGKLRKFHNDSFIISNDFFEEVLPIVRQLEDIKPMVFFLNGNVEFDNIEPTTVCVNSNELIDHIGYYITWFGGFCIWGDHLEKVADFGRMAPRRLIQVDNILRSLNEGRKFFVFNKNYFGGQKFGKKLDYNVAEIFGDNLVDLIINLLTNDPINDDVMFKFKHNLLFNHIIPSHFNSELGSYKTGFNKFLNYFYEDKKFLNSIAKNYIGAGAYISDERLLLNSIVWKKLNVHNQTVLKNYIDLDKVKVAHLTYGALNIGSWGAQNERLEIGALCSIGDNVNFMLGGNHDLHHLTTYPFKVKLGVAHNEASSKGAIVVEDDVWIGNNCTILSGVRVGRGAVIGTGSVIAKDVPPYAIVVGNPASVIKYRFSTGVIQELMKIDLKRLAQLENLQSHLEILYEIVNEDSCPEVIEYFRRLQCLTDDHL